MANENNPAGAVNELVDVLSNVAKQQAEALNKGITSASQLIEPAGKAFVSILSSVLTAATQIFQAIADALAPKK